MAGNVFPSKATMGMALERARGRATEGGQGAEERGSGYGQRLAEMAKESPEIELYWKANSASSHAISSSFPQYPASNSDAVLSGSASHLWRPSQRSRSPSQAQGKSPVMHELHRRCLFSPAGEVQTAHSAVDGQFPHVCLPRHYPCTACAPPRALGSILCSSSRLLVSPRTLNSSFCIRRTYSGVSPLRTVTLGILILPIFHAGPGSSCPQPGA